MKYQKLTKENGKTVLEEKEIQLEGVTSYSISLYKKIAQMEQRLELKESELTRFVSTIPSKDMEAYVDITDQIQRQVEEAYGPKRRVEENKLSR